MNALRRSISSCNDEKGKIDHFNNDNRQAITSKGSHRVPSLDTLIIPGRTRYPSDKGPPSRIVDVRVAEALLDRELRQNDGNYSYNALVKTNDLLRPPEPQRYRSLVAQTSKSLAANGFDGQYGHSRHSSGFSGSNSSRRSGGCSSLASRLSADRDPSRYVELYNHLARKSALTELVALAEDALHPKGLEDHPNQQSKRNIWRKLVRTSSSKDSDEPEHQKLVKKNSLGNLLGKSSKLALNCPSLDLFYCLGGMSVLNLPSSLSATYLAIPTCLAATANYLAEHGRETPGLFRIPGQATAVNNLYDHYVSQVHLAERAPGQIQATVGSAALPVEIACGIHDVASAFKKFLWDLPGGILGSVTLFRALRELQAMPESVGPDPQSHYYHPKDRMIALAILSLRSTRRIAVLTAVFGLLAFLKQDRESQDAEATSPSKPSGAEIMSSKALAIVFAPTLLGDLGQKIDVPPSSRQKLRSKPAETPRKSLMHALKGAKSSKPNNQERTPELNASIERLNVAAGIVELLVKNWEGIVHQVQLIESIPNSKYTSRSIQDLTSFKVQMSRCHLPQDDAERSSEKRRLDPGLFPWIGRTFDDPPDFQKQPHTNRGLQNGHAAFRETSQGNVSVLSRSDMNATREWRTGSQNLIGSQSSTSLRNVSTRQPSSNLGNRHAETRTPILGKKTPAWWEKTPPRSYRAALNIPCPTDEPIDVARHRDTPDAVGISPRAISLTNSHAMPDSAEAQETSGSRRNSRQSSRDKRRDFSLASDSGATIARDGLSAPIRDAKLEQADFEEGCSIVQDHGGTQALEQESGPSDGVSSHATPSSPAPTASIGQKSSSIQSGPEMTHSEEDAYSALFEPKSTHPDQCSLTGACLLETTQPFQDLTGVTTEATHTPLALHGDSRQRAASIPINPRVIATPAMQTPNPARRSSPSKIPKPALDVGRTRQDISKSADAAHRQPRRMPHTARPCERFASGEDLFGGARGRLMKVPPSARELSLPALHMDVNTRYPNVWRPPPTSLSQGPNMRRLRGPSGPGSRAPLNQPPIYEPPVARRLVFRNSAEDTRSRDGIHHCSSSEESFRQGSWREGAPPLPPNGNIGTLYGEVRKLKVELDARGEEVLKLRSELEAMRYFRDSGTLSEKLRDAERDLRIWRNRAQWAEGTLSRGRRVDESSGGEVDGSAI